MLKRIPTHYIREQVVFDLVLESMQRVLKNVQIFEKEFARKQMECYSEDKKKELAEKRRELNKAKRPIAEIDGLIQKLTRTTPRVSSLMTATPRCPWPTRRSSRS